MSEHPWLTRLLRSDTARRCRPRTRRRLHLEPLEGRLAPAILTVNGTADTAQGTDPYLSLREALAIVNSPSLPTGLSPQILGQISGALHGGGADAIGFDLVGVTGPIVLGGSQLELSLPADTATVTIDGGAGGTTLDGNNASRILQVDAGVQATLTHLTLTHGRASGSGVAYYGGGIYAFPNSTLAVNDCTLSANTAGWGGAITAAGRCTLTVAGCTLSANSVPAGGGGIDVAGGGSVTVRDSTLTGNAAQVGTALFGDLTSSVTVTGCTLANNASPDPTSSGCLYVNDGTLTVSNSALTGNVGGGIYATNSTLTVSGCTLAGNSTRAGGAVYADFGTATVSNCTLSGNTAAQGGGIYMGRGAATVSNCTLTDNSASDIGGGLSTGPYVIQLWNTIVAGNRGGDVSGSYTASHSLIGGDPRLAPLGYYGGPTQTMPPLPGSPALNAGDPTVATATDQRGQPRVVAGHTDIGSFQTQADPFLVTTLADPGREFGLLSLREAVALANVLPGDNAVSFEPAMDGGAVILTAGQLELSSTGGVATIDGAGRFAVSGGNRTRLFEIDPGTRATVRGFDLTGGNAPSGAAVHNQGTLTLADCTLFGNTAYNGGAVLNQGLLTLSGCAVYGNVATLGAGIDNEGDLIAYNSTFAYNSALEAGGAIHNAATGTATLTSLTVSRNSADTGGGLDVVDGAAVLVRNCIVAGNQSADGSVASDVAGAVDAGSTYNLIGTGGSGGLLDGVNHNQVGVADPGLTEPVFSGPDTPAFGLADDSPAAGAGDPTLLSDPVLRLDQHGNVRTEVNIGAV